MQSTNIIHKEKSTPLPPQGRREVGKLMNINSIRLYQNRIVYQKSILYIYFHGDIAVYQYYS